MTPSGGGQGRRGNRSSSGTRAQRKHGIQIKGMAMKRIVGLFLALVAYAGIALAAVNINSATKEQLESLDGIGPVKAQAIIDYRKKNGPFKSLEDVKKVDGVGDATFEKIRKDISLSGTTKIDAPAKAEPKKAEAKKEEPKKEEKKADAKKAEAKKEEPKKEKAAAADAKKADKKDMKEEKKADDKKAADEKKADKKAADKKAADEKKA
ncbi:MAG: helix-hairpin-helix domain-containing protein, partial [Betaproteobacteria bacterium]|nr:helix-hairpin-helix domain-containing protein [Betaproteobacteria bacterium]